MSRVLDFDPQIRNVQTLVAKNASSYHTSPPYTGKTNKIDEKPKNTRVPSPDYARLLFRALTVGSAFFNIWA